VTFERAVLALQAFGIVVSMWTCYRSCQVWKRIRDRI